MGLTRVALKHHHLVLYVEDEQALLFHRQQASVFELNPLSVSLLLAIDEGLEKGAAIAKVSTLSGISPDDITSYYLDVAQLFTQEKPSLTYLAGRYPELTTLTSIQRLAPKTSLTIQIAEASFALVSDDIQLAEAIKHVLAPCVQPLNSVDFVINISRSSPNSEPTYRLSCNDIEFASVAEQDFVGPLIIDHLQVLSFQKSDYRYCFHGAALQSAQGNLLLPGKSGVGKSTLTALMAAHGYNVYSDEMIAFDRHFNIKTLALPIALKSGSWSTMLAYYPELADAKVWQRLDGRQLKYVWPKHFAKDEQLTITANLQPHFVCPSYHEDIPKLELACLSIIDTLRLLTEGGYQLGQELNQELLDNLCDYLALAERQQISFSSNAQILAWLPK